MVFTVKMLISKYRMLNQEKSIIMLMHSEFRNLGLFLVSY